MKPKTALLLGLGVAVLGVVGYLLFSLRQSGGEDTDHESGSGTVTSKVPGPAAPVDDEKPLPITKRAVPLKPSAPGPSAHQTPTSAVPPTPGAADAGGARRSSKPPTNAELAFEAKKREIVYYRTAVTSYPERVEKLKGVLARIEREPGATSEQKSQIQSQIQQLADAQPRLKAHLEVLEKELSELEKAQAQKPTPP
jgi:hypothetical protein